MSDKELWVIKLGGSVISDKTKDMVFREEVIDHIVSDISKLNKRLMVVHGVGSAGHPPVLKYEIHKGFKSKDQLEGLTIAQNRVNKVRQLIAETFEKYRLPGFLFYPSSFIESSKGRISSIFETAIKKYFDLGAIPILSGDVVVDTAMGFSVLSGDQIVTKLAQLFNADKVIYGIDVDGLFTAPPNKVQNAKHIPEIKLDNLKRMIDAVGGSQGIDVSGGMRGKIKEIILAEEFLKQGKEIILLNMLQEHPLTRLERNDPTLKMTRIKY
ncbi:MAG: hypothetical protein DRO67_02585 [Candidatus Asgardarchaeum californiense]|nr:MAG: hypothetical protein DRO67_02585 [Candidatus Asgardarchaeum californiense]